MSRELVMNHILGLSSYMGSESIPGLPDRNFLALLNLPQSQFPFANGEKCQYHPHSILGYQMLFYLLRIVFSFLLITFLLLVAISNASL